MAISIFAKVSRPIKNVSIQYSLIDIRYSVYRIWATAVVVSPTGICPSCVHLKNTRII